MHIIVMIISTQICQLSLLRIDFGCLSIAVLVLTKKASEPDLALFPSPAEQAQSGFTQM
jgi:hypothetical protein